MPVPNVVIKFKKTLSTENLFYMYLATVKFLSSTVVEKYGKETEYRQMVVPTLFLLRHAAELVLKAAILHDTNKRLKTHSFLLLKEKLLNKFPEIRNNHSTLLEAIDFFHTMDQTGEVFRYATDLSGNAHFSEDKEVYLGKIINQFEIFMENMTTFFESKGWLTRD